MVSDQRVSLGGVGAAGGGAGREGRLLQPLFDLLKGKRSCFFYRPRPDWQRSNEFESVSPKRQRSVRFIAARYVGVSIPGIQKYYANRSDADLLLLQSLDEGVLEPVGVLRLEGLFLIGHHALLAQDSPALLLLPVGGEIRSALGTEEGLRAAKRSPQFACRAKSGEEGTKTPTCGLARDYPSRRFSRIRPVGNVQHVY